MTIEEVVGILEDLGGTVGSVTRETENLYFSQTPYVGEGFDSLTFKIQEIDYAAKTFLDQITDALKQAEGAMSE